MKKSTEVGLSKYGLLVIIPSTLLAYTLAGFLFGYVCWIKLGLPNWGMAIGSLLGLALAFYRIVLLTRSVDQSK